MRPFDNDPYYARNVRALDIEAELRDAHVDESIALDLLHELNNGEPCKILSRAGQFYIRSQSGRPLTEKAHDRWQDAVTEAARRLHSEA